MNSEFHISLSLTKDQSLILKCIAICAMLWHHLFAYVPSSVSLEFNPFVTTLGEIGKVCVAIFLFVSGYGLFKQYDKLVEGLNPPTSDVELTKFAKFKKYLTETLKYEFKRFSKFYKNYWIIFIIFVPIGVFVFGRTFADAYGADSNLYLSFLGDWFGMMGLKSYNVTWWFNEVIIILYLFFPILYWCVKKAGLVILVLTCIWINSPFGFIDFASPWAFPFVVGMCCVRYQSQLEWFVNKIGKPASIIIAVLFTLFWVCERQLSFIPNLGGIFSDGFIAFGLFFIIALSVIPKWINASMKFVGVHSSNIYMIHTFYKSYWFTKYIYFPQNPIAIFALLMGVSLLTSMAIEKLKGN